MIDRKLSFLEFCLEFIEATIDQACSLANVAYIIKDPNCYLRVKEDLELAMKFTGDTYDMPDMFVNMLLDSVGCKIRMQGKEYLIPDWLGEKHLEEKVLLTKRYIEQYRITCTHDYEDDKTDFVQFTKSK